MPYIIAPLDKVKGEGAFPEYMSVLKALQDKALDRAGQIWEGYSFGGLYPGDKQFGICPLRQREMANDVSATTLSGSYNFRKNTGEQALMNNRAAQGLLRTGGTLKDLLDYNQNFASQEYGNMRERKFGGWRGNANVALPRGALEQERGRSMYEPKLFEWTKKADLGSRAEDVAYDRSYREFDDAYNRYRDQDRDIFDRLKWITEFGND